MCLLTTCPQNGDHRRADRLLPEHLQCLVHGGQVQHRAHGGSPDIGPLGAEPFLDSDLLGLKRGPLTKAADKPEGGSYHKTVSVEELNQ